jgi:hypothetical protein
MNDQVDILTPTKTKQVEEDDEKVQFRATTDTATKERLKQLERAYLAKVVKSGKPPKRGIVNILLADTVLWVYSNPTRRRDLERFYTDKWLPYLAPVERAEAFQLKWSTIANAALAVIANENIGTNNKSETLRVIIAFVAERRYGLELKRVYQ